MSIRPKNKRVNRAWLNEHLQDTYVQLAQKEGYRARAAYKLKEIDEALGLVKPGQVVVDLGSAPGAWSQYLRRRFAPARAPMHRLGYRAKARWSEHVQHHPTYLELPGAVFSALCQCHLYQDDAIVA